MRREESDEECERDEEEKDEDEDNAWKKKKSYGGKIDGKRKEGWEGRVSD